MIYCSEERFFTSNLLCLGDWTPNSRATQNWVDVGDALPSLDFHSEVKFISCLHLFH
jgi:hypothetical protein